MSQKPLNLRHCYHELQRTNELYALNDQRPCVKHASVSPMALIIHLFPIAFLTPFLVMQVYWLALGPYTAVFPSYKLSVFWSHLHIPTQLLHIDNIPTLLNNSPLTLEQPHSSVSQGLCDDDLGSNKRHGMEGGE
ncbi:hypothetical protein NC653_000088 [Populus alba x Populus x berolinensis]|uniref:Uncharacterized protein n=1 Tax=Populus alba x Populus x berolinensis TaxID=444605 RepID=A0AAD6RIA9_9ROSI|nr:hypothetical protein NC653_000088 [Populus alba x Populus x berolinensis]